MTDDAAGQRVWRNPRLLWSGAAIVVLVSIVVGVAAIRGALRGKAPVASECEVAVGPSRFVLDVQQAANATTITAVGKRLGMPDHAVTIALATALQESQ